MKRDPFRPCENGKKLLSHEVPYLSVIGAIMYLVNCTCLNIAFLSIYYQGTVLLQLEDIRITSNMYYVISLELLI